MKEVLYDEVIMFFFKKKLSEIGAAMIFVLKINEWAAENDVAIKAAVQGVMLDNKCPLEQFKEHSDELYYATLAFLMQSIKNLFSAPQAQRLENKIYETVKYIGNMSHLQMYLDAQKEYFDPINAIPNKLIRRWLGEDIQLSAVNEMLMCMQVNYCFMPIIGYWKQVQKTYKLIESDEKIEQLLRPIKDN